jgi:PASTA domain
MKAGVLSAVVLAARSDGLAGGSRLAARKRGPRFEGALAPDHAHGADGEGEAVLKQRPPKGTRLPNGGKVNLTVGRGPRR